MIEKFRGTGVALVTPFHKDGSIDFKSFERLIEYQISNGINYIVLLGTTGESVTLNKDEKNAVINLGIEIINGRVPLVVGIGGNNTQEIVNTIKATNFEGVDAVLSVSPYYNKPQQKGIFLHYKTIAGVCPLPLIIYNVPSRTGSNISWETTLRIAAEVPNVIGVKEASGNLNQCVKIIKERPEGFLVISGDDALTLPMLACGGDGVISVIANAYPKEFSSMVIHGLNNDFEKAREIHLKMADLIEGIYADGSPSGIKSVLEMLELAQSHVRLPLVKVNKAVFNNLSTAIQMFANSKISVS